jgi:hypothetical protein
VPTAGDGHRGLSGWLPRLRLSLGAGWRFVLPLLAIIALIVGYVLKTEVYDRWRARRSPRPDVPARAAEDPRTSLGRRYARMGRALARLGLPRRAAETPAEYAARALPFLDAGARAGDLPLDSVRALSGLVSGLSAAFAHACYAAPGALAPRPGDWGGAVASLESAARRALWRRLWRRVRPPRPNPGGPQRAG